MLLDYQYDATAAVTPTIIILSNLHDKIFPAPVTDVVQLDLFLKILFLLFQA